MKQVLTLLPDTFLWLKASAGLLYNAKTFEKDGFNCTPSLKSLCSALLFVDNLYSVEIEPENFTADEAEFVDLVIRKKYGFITRHPAKAYSLPPVLSIQNDIKKLENSPSKSFGEDILKYLTTLTIYAGGRFSGPLYYRQTFYPFHSESCLEDLEILNFLGHIHSRYIKKVNIVFSHIESTNFLISLTEKLKATAPAVVYYCHVRELSDNVTSVLTQPDVTTILICEYEPASLKVLNDFLASDESRNSFEFNFLIRSQTEYNYWEHLVAQYKIQLYRYIPIYDNNYAFFKQFVFLNEEDITNTRLSKRIVFAHQAVNINFFGKLVLLPDRLIYSNVNKPPIGCMQDSPYDLIKNELHRNFAWRVIRDQEPCSGCVYQWLCPSPCQYELILGKNNLCTLK